MFKRPTKRIKNQNQETVWKYTHCNKYKKEESWKHTNNQQLIKYKSIDDIWVIFDKLKKELRKNGHKNDKQIIKEVNNLELPQLPELEQIDEADEYDENAELDGYPSDNDFYYNDYECNDCL